MACTPFCVSLLFLLAILVKDYSSPLTPEETILGKRPSRGWRGLCHSCSAFSADRDHHRKQNSRCLTHRLVRESFAENLQGGDSGLARIGMKLLETTIL